MDLIQQIKDMAHKVAEDYLLLGKSMNASVIDLWTEGKIDNEEIIKRICELANQNVYLSMFNDPKVNKGDIKFDLADFDAIYAQTQQGEKSMNDYLTPPEEPKSILAQLVQAVNSEIPKTASVDEYEKIASVHALNNTCERLDQFISSVEILRNTELKGANEMFNKIAYDTKMMVSHGDSIGDIAKIAAIGAREHGADAVKVAQVYNIIHKDLLESGFNVSSEFTKISSMKVNINSPFVKAAANLALCMEKSAAFEEMLSGARKTRDELRLKLKGAI